MRYIILTALTFLLQLITAQQASDFKVNINDTELDLPAAMAATNTSGFSYFLHRKDQQTAAFQLGTLAPGSEQQVNQQTRFQAGSPSASLLAFVALKLVEEGKIALDQPVNSYLKSWQIPGRKPETLTVRDLLLSRAKLGTTYKPKGYPAGVTLPSLVDILNGENGAQNKPFQFKGLRTEKDDFEYGGWLVLQLLLEDQYELPIATILEREVLQPLQMNNSLYAAELPVDLEANTAKGHTEKGKAIADGYFRYPELANHGLWTTPADFSKFVRHIMEAAKGKDNRFISQELAKQATTPQFGQRALIFHINEYNNLFWGGATKGFYFYMQANLELDYVVVTACNRTVNWQLCNQTCWQTYPIVKSLQQTNRMGVFYQPEDEAQLAALLPQLKEVCSTLDVRLEMLPITNGIPAEITGTPAFVFQNEAGRSIHAGKHLDIEALTVFLKTNLINPRPTVTDQREQVAVYRAGRQQIIVPVKMTALTSDAPRQEAEVDFAALMANSIYAVPNWQAAAAVALQPTDRRFYLDVHPYQASNGNYFLSYAIFSQFNCHEQLTDNFARPIQVSAEQLETGMQTLAETAMAQIMAYRMDMANGEVPRPIAQHIAATDWAALNWALPASAKQALATESKPVYFTKELGRLRPLQTGLPLVQFNFPAPLDRYAGEVKDIQGKFWFSNSQQQQINGNFTVGVKSLTMGNASLDTYVVGEALKTRRYPEATLVFREYELATSFMLGQPQEVLIPATFELMGKTHTVELKTKLTPVQDAAGQLQLQAQTSFSIDIKKMYGLKGPDGPSDIKNQVVISTQFLLA